MIRQNQKINFRGCTSVVPRANLKWSDHHGVFNFMDHKSLSLIIKNRFRLSLLKQRYGIASDFAMQCISRGKTYPWIAAYNNIRQRCENPLSNRYYRYGGRGIKCLINSKILFKYFIRDRAYLMNRPSVDRINNDGHYSKENIRWLELIENISRSSKLKLGMKYKCKKKQIHNIDTQG